MRPFLAQTNEMIDHVKAGFVMTIAQGNELLRQMQHMDWQEIRRFFLGSEGMGEEEDVVKDIEIDET